MLIVLSPSKTLDYSTAVTLKNHTKPALLKHTQELIGRLREYTPEALGALMDISPRLAALNMQRYRDFSLPFTPKNARQALLAFKGDVYAGIPTADYSAEDFAFAQQHLRILSGLYGLLRPLDLMQPYRLEMGTSLRVGTARNLYDYWGDTLTRALNQALADSGTDMLVNLASEEYFKALRPAALKGRILTVSFKEKRGNKLQTIGLFAKKARGRMADYAVQERITEVKRLKKFNEDGYIFQPELSSEQLWLFSR